MGKNAKFKIAAYAVTVAVMFGTGSMSAQGAVRSDAESGPGVTTQQGVALAPNVTSSMCTPEYWISRTRDAGRVLMTQEQIQELNTKIVQTAEANVIDLSALPEVYDGRDMADRMATFTSPEKLYLNGEPVPESYYQAIRDNIKNSQVSRKMPLRYGFVVNHTVMKGYPYGEFLSDSAADAEWDNLASAGIYVNEPLAVYFFTGDGRFAFVKASFCAGWVPTEDIAVCKDKAEWDAARDMKNILVVTGEKVYLEAGINAVQTSEKRLAMGTVVERVPVSAGEVEETSMGSLVSGRQTWNNYVVKLPCRRDDGSFYQELALVPANRDVSTRYLAYTTGNVITQAFKSLGNRYGWGGMLYGQDCSSYVRDVYRCFGLMIPRNTTWQGAMPVEMTLMKDMTDADRIHALNEFMPGTILQILGHEMLYLGCVDGKYYTINDISSLVSPEDMGESPSVLRIRSVIVNDLGTKRRSGKTWMEELTKAIKISGK